MAAPNAIIARYSEHLTITYLCIQLFVQPHWNLHYLIGETYAFALSALIALACASSDQALVQPPLATASPATQQEVPSRMLSQASLTANLAPIFAFPMQSQATPTVAPFPVYEQTAEHIPQNAMPSVHKSTETTNPNENPAYIYTYGTMLQPLNMVPPAIYSCTDTPSTTNNVPHSTRCINNPILQHNRITFAIGLCPFILHIMAIIQAILLP